MLSFVAESVVTECYLLQWVSEPTVTELQCKCVSFALLSLCQGKMILTFLSLISWWEWWCVCVYVCALAYAHVSMCVWDAHICVCMTMSMRDECVMTNMDCYSKCYNCYTVAPLTKDNPWWFYHPHERETTSGDFTTLMRERPSMVISVRLPFCNGWPFMEGNRWRPVTVHGRELPDTYYCSWKGTARYLLLFMEGNRQRPVTVHGREPPETPPPASENTDFRGRLFMTSHSGVDCFMTSGWTSSWA